MHVAVIMDGNGRWAKAHNKPRTFGHRKGAKAVQICIESALKNNIQTLSLFAFSSENWKRPQKEVQSLMNLFTESLKKNETLFHQHQIRFYCIGDKNQFNQNLQNLITQVEHSTCNYGKLHLVIAANYGGQWDINNAHQLACQHNCHKIEPYLALNQLDLPKTEVDLLIRTGGEKRISNFVLWHLAYSELYFSDIFWPDFDEYHFKQALNFFNQRNRRFGSIQK